MPVIIEVQLKAQERLVCEECGGAILEGEIAYLDLDWYRQSPKVTYCEPCKEAEYPWL